MKSGYRAAVCDGVPRLGGCGVHARTPLSPFEGGVSPDTRQESPVELWTLGPASVEGLTEARSPVAQSVGL